MMKRLFTLFALFLLISACRKDSDVTNIIDTQDPIPRKNVESSVTGSVTSDQGIALAGAQININGNLLTSNEKGHYFLNEKLLNANGNYVKASKDGYFTTGRFTQAHLNTSDNLDLQLIPKSLIQTIDPTVANTLNFEGCSVQFQANAMVDANGKSIVGNVRFYAAYFNPLESANARKLPGDGRLITANGGASLLKSYAIIAVELVDSKGEKVYLHPQKPAILYLTTPNGQTLPQTAKLAHFDENTGIWKEEGAALLTAGKYIGSVSHFTFWAVGNSAKFSKLSGSLRDQNNAPLSNLTVFVYSANQGFAADQTNANGQFDGLVPNDEALKLVVKDNCDQILYQQDLGKIGADLDLKAISVKIDNQYTITGSLVDCNAAPLKSGVVYISDLSGKTISTQQSDVNGQFSISLSNCKLSKIVVTAYDNSQPLRNNPITIDLQSNTVSTGALVVCDQLDEYVYLRYNGETKIIAGAFEHTYQKTPIEIVYNDPNTSFFMTFNPTGGGLGDMEQLAFITSFGSQIQSVNCNFCAGCSCNSADKLNLTYLAKPQEYTTGNLTGTYKNGLGEIKPYRIDFKVKRDN